MLVLDICSGTGSSTQAFKDRGHKVITVDKFDKRADIVIDIMDFPAKNFTGKVDFLWMSPPCTEFSLANWRKGKCQTRKVDLSIVKRCFELVEIIRPKYWVMENPRACLKYFIGEPKVTINYNDFGYPVKKPTNLWGYFPKIPKEFGKVEITKHIQTMNNIDDRYHVPYNLGKELCKAIERKIEK